LARAVLQRIQDPQTRRFCVRGARMSTIHFHVTTTSTPEQFIAGLTNFGPGRQKLFGNSAAGCLKVHHRGPHGRRRDGGFRRNLGTAARLTWTPSSSATARICGDEYWDLFSVLRGRASWKRRLRHTKILTLLRCAAISSSSPRFQSSEPRFRSSAARFRPLHHDLAPAMRRQSNFSSRHSLRIQVSKRGSTVSPIV
jgi:hypothetical protein